MKSPAAALLILVVLFVPLPFWVPVIAFSILLVVQARGAPLSLPVPQSGLVIPPPFRSPPL